MNKEQTVIRGVLVFLSLLATFVFLVGLGSGFAAILFALGGTVIQLTALLYLPGLMTEAWSNDRLIVSGLSCFALVAVVLISVAGSASILSGLAEEDAQAASERAGLVALANAKQESADRLIALDHISRAQPILEEVAEIRAQITNLPAPSGFYLAAQRIAGTNAYTLITVVILTLALLLDGIILLLGIESQPQTVDVISETREEAQPQPQPEPQPTSTQEYERELLEIRKAIKAGELNAPSVRSVRALLGCSQNKAIEVARLCRAAEQQMSLI